MKYLLVGGAGYVGARLYKRLCANPENTVEVLDPGLLWPKHVEYPHPVRDVRGSDPNIAQGYDCVIWLATIHDVPPEEAGAWFRVTRELMVDLPRRWEKNAHRFVYFSSMRAETHPKTLYGRRKKAFEDHALSNTLCIRPGTVWGGYHPDLPNRNHTALNRAVLDPDADIKIPKNFVHVDNLVDLTLRSIEGGKTGIVEAVDLGPWQRPKLGTHPMEIYRSFYDVK